MSNGPQILMVGVSGEDDDAMMTEPKPFNAAALEVLDRHKEPSDAMIARKAKLDALMEVLRLEYEKLAEESQAASKVFYDELYVAQPELKDLPCLHISDDHQTWQTHVVRQDRPSGARRLLKAIFGHEVMIEEEAPVEKPKLH